MSKECRSYWQTAVALVSATRSVSRRLVAHELVQPRDRTQSPRHVAGDAQAGESLGGRLGDLCREQLDDALSGERSVDEECLSRAQDEHLTGLGGISECHSPPGQLAGQRNLREGIRHAKDALSGFQPITHDCGDEVETFFTIVERQASVVAWAQILYS